MADMEKHQEEKKNEMGPVRINMASMYASIIEIGLSFGDGRLGRWSLYMAPPAAILTAILQIVTLFVADYTEQKRKGTMKPSFFYSPTLAVISSFLGLWWLVIGIVTFVRLGQYNNLDYVRQPVKPAAWAEVAFAMVNMVLLWIQVIVVFYGRRRFFKRVQRAGRGITPYCGEVPH
ncbi:hypothetical protein FRB91_010372 [Serendipita sp. 411]|nr:hypothetical protein FRB91_010372 [Serendipita sp. 411]